VHAPPSHPTLFRSPTEDAYFRECLKTLPKLFSSAPVVSLRAHGDDYATRGWCLAELASGALGDFSPLVLRYDLLNQPVEKEILDSALLGVKNQTYNKSFLPSAQNALQFLQSWPAIGVDEIGYSKQGCTRTQCAGIFNECQAPETCCQHSNFGVWCSQGLMVGEIEARTGNIAVVAPVVDTAHLLFLSAEDYLEGCILEGEMPDLCGHMRKELSARRIMCTNGADTILVGFWMMHSATVIDNEWGPLFQECYERYARGQGCELDALYRSGEENSYALEFSFV
jgi:hypothetical protein